MIESSDRSHIVGIPPRRGSKLLSGAFTGRRAADSTSGAPHFRMCPPVQLSLKADPARVTIFSLFTPCLLGVCSAGHTPHAGHRTADAAKSVWWAISAMLSYPHSYYVIQNRVGKGSPSCYYRSYTLSRFEKEIWQRFLPVLRCRCFPYMNSQKRIGNESCLCYHAWVDFERFQVGPVDLEEERRQRKPISAR